MLERHEVEAFLTLAEELHFGRTAQRLRVSTTRVSQTIRKVERLVGAPLFHRTSRRVELTALGRQLDEELRPAWTLVTTAVERAIEVGRGVTGTLRVAFVGAAAGQLLVGVSEQFRRRLPGCEVEIREAQLPDVLPWLRDGEVEIAFATIPVDDPELTAGPVLIREARMLAVPVEHPFARRESVSMADLAGATVLQPGEAGRTFNEILTLVGAGRGVFPVGAQARRYYQRPDVAYIPIGDAPPLEWGLIWRAGNARIHAFGDAALATVSA